MVDAKERELYAEIFDEGAVVDGKPCFTKKETIRYFNNNFDNSFLTASPLLCHLYAHKVKNIEVVTSTNTSLIYPEYYFVLYSRGLAVSNPTSDNY